MFVFPGHSQVLSHSCGEKSGFSPQLRDIKSGSGLGTRISCLLIGEKRMEWWSYKSLQLYLIFWD